MSATRVHVLSDLLPDKKKVIAIIQLFSTRLKRWKLPYTQHNASSFSFLPAEPSQKLLQSIQSISKLSLPPQTGAILF